MEKAAKRINVKTSVGGQAVMEGIMMRGPAKWCLAVRTPSGQVVTELHDVKAQPWRKWPLVRGVAGFVDSLVTGYKTLMRSAELAMGEDFAEEEPGKFDLWVEKHFGDKGAKLVMVLAGGLGVLLAAGLFMLAPTAAVSGLDTLVPLGGWKPVLEGNMNHLAILKACRQAGVQDLMVEQDECEGDPFEALSLSFRNLQSCGLC